MVYFQKILVTILFYKFSIIVAFTETKIRRPDLIKISNFYQSYELFGKIKKEVYFIYLNIVC